MTKNPQEPWLDHDYEPRDEYERAYILREMSAASSHEAADLWLRSHINAQRKLASGRPLTLSEVFGLIASGVLPPGSSQRQSRESGGHSLHSGESPLSGLLHAAKGVKDAVEKRVAEEKARMEQGQGTADRVAETVDAVKEKLEGVIGKVDEKLHKQSVPTEMPEDFTEETNEQVLKALRSGVTVREANTQHIVDFGGTIEAPTLKLRVSLFGADPGVVEVTLEDGGTLVVGGRYAGASPEGAGDRLKLVAVFEEKKFNLEELAATSRDGEIVVEVPALKPQKKKIDITIS